MSSVAAVVSCNICGTATGEPLYHSTSGSITSLAKPFDGTTTVFQCPACAHVQTPALDNIAGYYDTEYNVRADSADADDLYALRDGVPVYRTEHQAAEALAKLNPAAGARILDYGCGKARTLRHMIAARPDVQPSVFDVSGAYRGFWDEFVPRDEQAAYSLPERWAGRFDAVLSFYALEHVANPRAFLATIRRLLRPGGSVHIVVPNVRRNAGDLIVVDHVNHFMPSSLRKIFALEGFERVTIDEESNTAAYVVNAVRSTVFAPGPSAGDQDAVTAALDEARSIATFWAGARERVAAFERAVRGRRAAIYGSGFYGAFIAAALAERESLAYFLDRNPHQQAKRIFDRPVLAPEAVGGDIEVVYAGLNPERARTILAGVPSLHSRPREFFYL